MKQHLNQVDILSLSEAQRRKLLEWWKPVAGDIVIWGDDTRPLVLVNDLIDDGEWKAIGTSFYLDGADQYNRDRFLPLHNCLPLLSIGQVIQFIDEYNHDWWHLAYQDVGFVDDTVLRRTKNVEFIDALFEAVKEIL